MNFENKIRYFLITLMLLLYVVFMATIVITYDYSIGLMVFATVVTCCVLIACYKLPIHYHHYTTNKGEGFLHALWIPITALLTFFINETSNIGIVLIASSIGLIGAFLPSFFKQIPYVKQLPEVIYCGVFVGMTSLDVAHTHLFILIAGSLAAVLYVFLKVFFRGVGGKLGSIAFGGVFFTSLLYLISQ